MFDIWSMLNAFIQGIIQNWYFWIIILIIILFKTPRVKGYFGELLVNKAMDFQLNKEKYHTLKNVTLETNSGTTQIDHIVVSEYGIFVIETKNMKGWIFGGEHQKIWTQKLYKHTSKFQNPLHQNYKHQKTISNLLNISDDKIFSVVVFTGESTFKTQMPENVIEGNRFIKYILSKQTKIFSSEEVNNIIATLNGERLPNTFETHRNHVSHLKFANEKKTASSNICPKCNSELVLRTVKKGENIGNQFYGCSNFPKCRFTKQIYRSKL